MFDIGFAELLVLFVLGLLILGPERLPRVVAQVGRWLGRARRTATQLRRQIEREIELDELTKAARKQQHRTRPQPPASPSTDADAGGPGPGHDPAGQQAASPVDDTATGRQGGAGATGRPTSPADGGHSTADGPHSADRTPPNQ